MSTPPPPGNSDQGFFPSVKEGCDFKFYRVTITNLSTSLYFLIDVYSNTSYIGQGSNVDIYLPYESKNLIFFVDGDGKFKLLQPCLINTTSNSFDLNISASLNTTFTKTTNPLLIPSKIYKVKFNLDIVIFNDSIGSKFIVANNNDSNCEEHSYLWLPQGSFYTIEESERRPEPVMLPVPPNNLPKTACEFNADISADIKQKINDLQSKFNINIFNKFKNDDK